MTKFEKLCFIVAIIIICSDLINDLDLWQLFFLFLSANLFIKIDTPYQNMHFKVVKIEVRHTEIFENEWQCVVVDTHANHNNGEITTDYHIRLDDLIANISKYMRSGVNTVQFIQPDQV